MNSRNRKIILKTFLDFLDPTIKHNGKEYKIELNINKIRWQE